MEQLEAEVVALRVRNAALEEENQNLRARVASLLDQGRALAARARVWIAGLRGDSTALRDIAEAPTLTESRIDATLLPDGRDQALGELQRRRVVAI